MGVKTKAVCLLVIVYLLLFFIWSEKAQKFLECVFGKGMPVCAVCVKLKLQAVFQSVPCDKGNSTAFSSGREQD